MTYATSKIATGREPFQYVEIDLDTCSLVYGVGACTAGEIAGDTAQAGAATSIDLAAGDIQADDYYNGMTLKIVSGTGAGTEAVATDYVNTSNKLYVASWPGANPDATSVYTIHNTAASDACYNTRQTCQDTANYTLAVKTFRFCDKGVRLPLGENFYPCIKKISLRSPEINPVKSIGVRGSATIDFDDFPHHDRGVDPYVDNRAYTPVEQGTFFGKLRARTPFYIGRPLRVYTGFYNDPFDTADFITHEFLIETMTGPDARGKVAFKAKDPLKLTSKDRALCPVATTGELAAAITGSPPTFTLDPAGIGNSEYAASGHVRIEDEIIKFTRSGDVMTVVTRGAWSTVSDDHAIDEAVQQCQSWEDINVVDIVDDLIRDFTNIDPAYIDTVNWNIQKGAYLSAQNLTAIISEPTGVDELLNELIEQNLFDFWWDQRNSLLRLRSFIPINVNTPPAPLNDIKHLIGGKSKRKDVQDRRVTQVWILYGPRDYSQTDDDADYSFVYVAADTDAESAEQYNEQRIEKITSRWFDATNRAQAIALAARLLQRYTEAPIELSFALDTKDDDLAIGDNFRTNTRTAQDIDGSNLDKWMQVISVQEDIAGGRVNYKALSMALVGPYGNVAPDSQVDYGAASDAEKAAYVFICLDTGLFSNGDTGYLLL